MCCSWLTAASAADTQPGNVHFAFNVVRHIDDDPASANHQCPGLSTTRLDDVCRHVAAGQPEVQNQWIPLPASQPGVHRRLSAIAQLISSSVSFADFHAHPRTTLAVPLFCREAHLLAMNPDVTKPCIMVAAGTGVAPFIGFLQQR